MFMLQWWCCAGLPAFVLLRQPAYNATMTKATDTVYKMRYNAAVRFERTAESLEIQRHRGPMNGHPSLVSITTLFIGLRV
jgi:hypothetical protein